MLVHKLGMLSQKICIKSMAKTDVHSLCSGRVRGSINTASVGQPDVLMQDFQDQKAVLQLYQLFVAMATIINCVLCWTCYGTSETI